MIRVLIVTEHLIPSPEDVTTILEQMDPPSLPYFAGAARVVIGEDADDCIRWLEEEGP